MTEPLKYLLVGAKGVGKSTAIECVTSAVQSQRAASRSLGIEATAPLIAGQVVLRNEQAVRLYAVPGDECADYRLDILARNADGIIFLIDHRAERAVRQLESYLERFSEYLSQSSAVVGITASEQASGKPLERYHRLLAQRGLVYPLFPVDVGERDDVLLLIEALLAER